MKKSALVASAALVGLSVLSACSQQPAAHQHGAAPKVVASTDVWASVAKSVAGDHATVSGIIKGSAVDPHSYEVTPGDAAQIQDAALVVYNGDNYDPFVDKLLKPGQARVNAFSLLPAGTPDPNEHVFYSLATVGAAADQIAAELGKSDPDNADTYKSNAKNFRQQLDSVASVEHAIADKHRGAQVASTEPVAHYLVAEAGLVDATPHGFAEAAENGTDPSPADVAAMQDLITSKKATALLFNIQTESPVAKQIKQSASDHGVPVVTVTETLPDGKDYITWQRETAQQLATSLGS